MAWIRISLGGKLKTYTTTVEPLFYGLLYDGHHLHYYSRTPLLRCMSSMMAIGQLRPLFCAYFGGGITDTKNRNRQKCPIFLSKCAKSHWGFSKRFLETNMVKYFEILLVSGGFSLFYTPIYKSIW